jgi:hypothetical protein
MNTKEIKENKKKLTLSNEQRAILVGLLLGDGHLETQNGGRTYRLKVEHSEKQVDYVHWLYELFASWIPSKPYRRVRPDGRISVGFTTYSHGSFRFYAQQFYPIGKKKVIPKLINKLLTQAGLAVWFMDDGSRKSSKHTTYNIHTLAYTKRDLERLQDTLLKKFGIITSLHRQKETSWRIYIPSVSAERFKSIIQPYVNLIPSMKVKLSNKNA